MFGSRLLDTSPGRRSALSDLLEVSGRYAAPPAHLLEVSGRYAAPPAHLRHMDGVGTSESGHGNYVSLAELATQLKASVQTIYDLRSKGRGPRGFRVSTQLRFRDLEMRELSDGTKKNYRDDRRLRARPQFEHFSLGEITTGA